MRPLRLSPALRVQRAVEAALDAHPQAPAALGVLVRNQGSEIYAAQAGWRRAGSGTGDSNRVGPDDVFCLGSVAKVVTGYALACLIQSRTDLGWGTHLGTAFPEFNSPAFRRRHGIRDVYPNLTLAHLMTHHSGRGGDPPAGHEIVVGSPPPADFLPGYTTDASEQERRYNYLLTFFAEQPEPAPGTTFRYSSIGAVTAAALLERRLKVNYREASRRLLFAPLGIHGARWRRTATQGTPPDGVWQHSCQAPTRRAIPTDSLTTLFPEYHSHAPAGALSMNAQSLGVLLASLLDQPAIPGPLSRRSRQAALGSPPFAPSRSRMGWGIDGGWQQHDGDNGSCYAWCQVHPASGVAVGVAANVGLPVGKDLVDALKGELLSIHNTL